MTAHTAGPWIQADQFGENSNGTCVKSTRDQFLVCECTGYYGRDGAIANARLISAAPELLGQHEADMADLELLARAIHAGDPMPELVLRVVDMLNRKRAAIAKATGQQA